MCKRVGRNHFDYRDDYSYTLLPHAQRSLQVQIYNGRRMIYHETIGGLTTRHTVVRAHRWARRYIDRLIKKRIGSNEMSAMIREVQPENVL